MSSEKTKQWKSRQEMKKKIKQIFFSDVDESGDIRYYPPCVFLLMICILFWFQLSDFNLKESHLLDKAEEQI